MWRDGLLSGASQCLHVDFQISLRLRTVSRRERGKSAWGWEVWEGIDGNGASWPLTCVPDDASKGIRIVDHET